MAAPEKQISMAASAIALRGVRLFLNRSKAAAEKRAPPLAAAKPKPKPKKVMPSNKLSQKAIDAILKICKFNKDNPKEPNGSHAQRLTIPTNSIIQE